MTISTDIFKKLSTRILYQAKLSSKSEVELKTFLDKPNREIIAIPAL